MIEKELNLYCYSTTQLYVCVFIFNITPMLCFFHTLARSLRGSEQSLLVFRGE